MPYIMYIFNHLRNIHSDSLDGLDEQLKTSSLLTNTNFYHLLSNNSNF